MAERTQTWWRLMWRLNEVRGRRMTWVGLALGALGLFASAMCCCAPTLRSRPTQPLRVATFNIENFPKHSRQHEGAFREILATKASILGIQEIVSPTKFAQAAREHLGSRFGFVFSKTPSPQRLGVLYDRGAYRLVRQLEHKESMLYPRARPVLEVVLADVKTDQRLHLLVLHLKAGGKENAMRTKQWTQIWPLLKQRRKEGARFIVLGDMNTTGPMDRANLHNLTRHFRLHWATRDLECTSYWRRRDGCKTAALDHILTTNPVRRTFLAGACGRQGCEERESCPTYCKEVSDHCPVVTEVSK